MKFSDTQVAAALAGRRQMRLYPFPGDESVSVGVRMLTDEQVDGIRARAQDYVKNKKIDLVIDPDFFDRVVQREVVAEAFMDPDKPDEPFFASAKDVAAMDATLVLACYELYRRHLVVMDPYAHCSPEDVEELVQHLGKPQASEVMSSLFDAPTLWSFVTSLASKLRETQQQLKSATG